jgi:Rrf2 family protein
LLSRRSKYGLKALFALAREPGGRPVLVADLAARDAMPRKFLEAILLDLNRRGFVQSRKGKGGGYLLRRPPEEITVGDVIRALEGPLALVPCVSRTAYTRCAECPDERTCGVRFVMRDVRDATAAILDNTTLADVVGRNAPGRRPARAGVATPRTSSSRR